MSIEHLYPFAGNHAIQNAAFAIEWSDELTISELLAISLAIGTELKTDFPKVTPQHTQKISFTVDASAPGGSSNYFPNPELSSYSFEKPSQFGNAQSARSMILSKSNLIVLINDYSRWDNVWADVKRYISIVLPKLPNKPIQNIGLQYSDVFTWKDDPKSFNSALVFRENSPYIVPNVHNASGLWHCHHGYLVDRTDPVQHTCLDNVNVNLLDTSGVLSLQIVTSHRATFASPLWFKGENDLTTISDTMNILHNVNKNIMYNLLNEDVCKKINLKA